MAVKLLALALVAIACVATQANAVAVSTCWLNSANAALSGYVRLSQDTTSGVVSITGVISSTETGDLTAHIHQWGVSAYGGCYLATDTTFLTVNTGGNSSIDIGTTTTSAFTLVGATSILGRTLAFYQATTSCAAALLLTPVATCVFGIASTQGLLNEAVSTLATLPPSATADLIVSSSGTGNVAAGGYVTFTPNLANGEVFVYAHVTGLVANSIHALHVHWYGEMTCADAVCMGGHVNPQNLTHGKAPSWWRHMGDIGNFTADSSGIINQIGSYNLLNFLGTGNIVGRGVVFHAVLDDANLLNTSASVGNAGARWARGVVGLQGTRELNPAYATCVFSAPGLPSTGSVNLWQTSQYDPVYISGTVGAPVSADFSIHAFTNGDLKDGTNFGACYSATGAALATFTTDGTTARSFLASTSDISLWRQGSNNIIGRSLGLFSGVSACSAATMPLAQCVVGIHSVAATLNSASQVLATVPTSAYCQLTPGPLGSGITGELYFSTSAVTDELQVQVFAQGLVPNSLHAVHVHWYGDMNCADALCMGGHLNPYGVNHGASPSRFRHLGDIGNTTADSAGVIHHTGSYNMLTFNALRGNIIGRGIVFHERRDDANPANTTTSVGDAGARYARCVIGISARSAPVDVSTGSSMGSTASMTGSMASTASMTGTGQVAGAAQITVSIAASVAAALVALVAAL
jgi:Cu-Zn family superoxide dismutase